MDDLREGEERDPRELSETAKIAPHVDVPEEIEERLKREAEGEELKG